MCMQRVVEGTGVDSGGCVEHVGVHVGGLWKALGWIMLGV